jgi:hypothetical protein
LDRPAPVDPPLAPPRRKQARTRVMSELRNIFENIMALNRWSGDESRSGPGSTLLYTCNLRSQLDVFINKFEIRTLFDAPCGDFNWMKEVRFPEEFVYIGGDIAPSLIEENIKKYSTDSRKFVSFDIVADRFPVCDVWFCRDCLFHLPNADIFRALNNFCDSKTKLLMMTNHINSTGFANVDIAAGEFRLIDFYSQPFSLPRDSLFQVADYVYPFPQREMCVWTREQIAAALKGAR